MGLVTNDLSDWLSEPAPESEENPFRAGVVQVALARFHLGWRHTVQRLREWFEAEDLRAKGP